MLKTSEGDVLMQQYIESEEPQGPLISYFANNSRVGATWYPGNVEFFEDYRKFEENRDQYYYYSYHDDDSSSTFQLSGKLQILCVLVLIKGIIY